MYCCYCMLLPLGGGWGLAIKKWGKGGCTIIIVVVTCHYLWWGVGISNIKSEGEGYVLSSSSSSSSSSSCIVTCGGG
jgi:hypothetical protein